MSRNFTIFERLLTAPSSPARKTIPNVCQAQIQRISHPSSHYLPKKADYWYMFFSQQANSATYGVVERVHAFNQFSNYASCLSYNTFKVKSLGWIEMDSIINKSLFFFSLSVRLKCKHQFQNSLL